MTVTKTLDRTWFQFQFQMALRSFSSQSAYETLHCTNGNRSPRRIAKTPISNSVAHISAGTDIALLVGLEWIMITSPTTQSLSYQNQQNLLEDWTSDRSLINSGLVQSPQPQSPTTRRSAPGRPTSTDDAEKRRKSEKRKVQNRNAQRAFRKRKKLENEQKKMKEQTETEPQEGKGIGAGSVHRSGLLQNKRPYEWDSKHNLDIYGPRLTRSMTGRKRQRSDSREGIKTSMVRGSITDQTVAPQEVHQPQVTTVSDAVVPQLLYCGSSPFPSVPTPGQFPSTPEYGIDEHASPSTQSKLPTLNHPLSPPLSQNDRGATNCYNFWDQPLESAGFMFTSNKMPPLMSGTEFSTVSYGSYQRDILPVECAIDNTYLPVVPNAPGCGDQDLTSFFLPPGEEPQMVPYGSNPNGIPDQILEQGDPAVIYFYRRMVLAADLDKKREERKLAETNLEFKRLELEQLKFCYGKGP